MTGNASPRHRSAQVVEDYLRPTYYLDADHPRLRELRERVTADTTDPVEKAVRLYYAIRDGLLYDPYSIEFTPAAFKASTILSRGRGFCVAKAVVLAAVARGAGIPARLGFADVRNHLATERLRQLMGTDVFYYHGFTELHIEGKWVKATPAFNIELCQRFGVLALEFDGRHDSIFHPFDAANRRHMEYINDRGTRADLPFEEIRDALARYYPHLNAARIEGDFHAEAAAERTSS
jgi:transglutaminase-like putative cysteine protease